MSAPRDVRQPGPGPQRGVSPSLTVAAVARRLGVAPATLRTWDRRYGLGPSAHLAGSHRRYSADDVARLVVMRRLTLDGTAPSEAARIARDADAEDLAAMGALPLASVVTFPGQRGQDTEPDGLRTLPPGLDPPLTLPGAESPTPTDVVDAALRYDVAACRHLLAAAPVADIGWWWTELVAPARSALASRTVLARAGEDPQQVLTAAVLAVLRARPAPPVDLADSARRVVLLTSPPDGTSRLPLHVLAAALTDAGVHARVVAGPTDTHRLVELCMMAEPLALVVLSEQRPADLALVAGVHGELPDLTVFVGADDDAAAAGLPLHRSIHRSRTFMGLMHEVMAASRGSVPP